MFRKFIVAFVFIFFVMSSTAFAADKPELKFTPGEVYKTTGEVYMDEANSYGSNIFDKTYARQIARMFALRGLAYELRIGYIETFSKVKEGKLVKDYAKFYTGHDSKVFELLTRHARQIGEAKFTPIDGGFKCEVTMELVIPADWK